MNAMTNHLNEKGAYAPFYLPQSDEIAVFEAAPTPICRCC